MKNKPKNTVKRSFAMLLSMVMCFGAFQTTAFAEGEDQTEVQGQTESQGQTDSQGQTEAPKPEDDPTNYVYVYINVTDLPKEGETVEEPPKFGDSQDEIDAINDFNGAKSNLQDADTKLDTSLTDVITATSNLEETMDRLTTAMGTADNQLGTAEKALENLESKMPYSVELHPENNGQTGNGQTGNGQTGNGQTGNGQTNNGQTENNQSAATSDSPLKPGFDAVEERIDALNEAQQAIAQDVSKANQTVEMLNQVQAVADEAAAEADKNDATEAWPEKAQMDAELATKRQEFADQKSIAEQKVTDANAAMDACRLEKENLDADFAEKVATLPAVSEEPKLQEGQDYDSYLAAHNAWDQERQAYNNALAEIQKEYDIKAADLTKLSNDAQSKVDEASKELAVADTKLNEFDTKLNAYNSSLLSREEQIKAYNDVVSMYNGKVLEYNAAADKPEIQLNAENVEAPKSYNEEAEAFNAAIDEFNGQINAFISAKETYEGKVGEYSGFATTYNQAVTAYNEKADEYNVEAAGWNTNNKNVDPEIWKQIKDQQEQIIKVENKSNLDIYNEVNEAIKAASELTGEEKAEKLNFSQEQVEAYNAVIKAYNAAVDKRNENVMDSTVSVVKETFKNQDSTTYTYTDGSKNTWFTIGKIYVGDIFEKNSQQINDSYANTNPAYHSTTGRDVYYWDDVEDELVFDNQVREGVTESEMYEDGKTREDLEDRLFVENKDGKPTSQIAISKLEIRFDGTVVGDEASATTGVVPMTADRIEKWVLKMDSGATDYYGDDPKTATGGKITIHLDGYLYVRNLAPLAELQARQKPVDEPKPEDYILTTVETFSADESVGSTKLKMATTYKERTPIDTTPPQPEDKAKGFDDGFEFKPYTLAPLPEEMPEKPPVTRPVTESDSDPIETTQTETQTETNIMDMDVPMSETPTIDVVDMDVPMTETPEIEVIDEEVPLADVPKTGDNSFMWSAMIVMSACGLMVIRMLKKREEDCSVTKN